VANRDKFVDKWRERLAAHPHDPVGVTATSLREMLMLGRER
jgi:hypothetical protein